MSRCVDDRETIPFLFFFDQKQLFVFPKMKTGVGTAPSEWFQPKTFVRSRLCSIPAF